MSISNTARKLMSDEERAKIVRKATEDTCQFLENLPRKQYQDGWAEDKWEEEMQKHPLFTTEISEDQDVPPLVAAFQSLKYDSECNDPTELAKAHKDDGNEQFKQKRYRLAATAYSEGLKMKSEDNELNTVLYTNRAAAYFHYGRYRESLKDVAAALTLNPNHVKAIHRGALCCLQMYEYDECISWCEKGLKLNDEDRIFLDLKRKAEDAAQRLKDRGTICFDITKQLEEQIKRREQLRLKAEIEKASVDKLIKAIDDRGINMGKDQLTPASVVCDYPGSSAKVHLTDDDELVWPVVLLYPQYRISDFITNFNENSSFYDYFCELFNEHPDWDIKKEYIPENLKVYFSDKNSDIVPVDPKKSLKNAMCHNRFQVLTGTLHFFVTCQSFDEIYRSQNYVANA